MLSAKIQKPRSTQAARRTLLVALLASSSLAGGTAAMAQTTPAKTDAQGVTQVEDLVVTARLRSESLQNVPVAVSVLTGALAVQENRNDVSALVAVIPSVEFRSQPSNKDQDILIRGLGTITTSAGAEPTVSTVIDGVVLARPGQMVSDLIDLDHIEVLRGPQGTLFGKNASAGVINIVTKDPTPTPGGFLDASYYTGNEYRVAGAVNGEIIKDTLSGRLAAVTSSFDGNVKNVFNNTKVNGDDFQGTRGKLLWTPNSDLRVIVGGDYMYTTQTGNQAIYLANYNIAYPTGIKTTSANLLTALTNEGIHPSFSNKDISLNSPSDDRDLTSGAYIQADYSLGGGYTLTSISAYRYWRNVQRQDLDSFSGLTTQTPTQQVDLGHVWEKQYSEELRLASPKGNLIDYVVGAYYLHEPDKENYRRDVTQLTAAGNVVNFGFNQFGATTTNYSGFGEANINFTKSFRAILGLRLVHDDLSFSTNRVTSSPTAVPGVSPPFAATGSAGVNGYADRIGVQYDISDTANTYFTYSRGYKGPAYNVFFNMTALQTNQLEPETSNAFELGLKSRLFDKRLQFNLALFDDTVSNYQANEPDLVAGTVVTRLINAGEVSTRGAEIDAVAKPIDNLTLSFDYAYTDAHIDSFSCPPGSAISCNVNGKPLPFAPRNKFTIRADYMAWTNGRYDVGLNTNYSWQSKQQDSIAETPDTIQPAYGIWNAAVVLTDHKGDWDVRLTVRNITDQHYYMIISEANGGLIGTAPRDFDRFAGIAFHKNF
ncbi:TonB-dependent receptor [Phenylobacterium sp.]|jgi:iron complex outermembrane receptor protein|uniref:TonB-dependent receptor n=1 Tax=Phenylobacterium sp. TaxID=1871053 RepID=UPI002F42D05F